MPHEDTKVIGRNSNHNQPRQQIITFTPGDSSMPALIALTPLQLCPTAGGDLSLFNLFPWLLDYNKRSIDGDCRVQLRCTGMVPANIDVRTMQFPVPGEYFFSTTSVCPHTGQDVLYCVDVGPDCKPKLRRITLKSAELSPNLGLGSYMLPNRAYVLFAC